MTRTVLILGSLGAALLLAACNDDDAPFAGTGTPVTPAASAATGSWQGSIDTPLANSRTARAVVLADGSFWMTYSQVGAATTAGIIRGTGSSDGSVFSVDNATLISLEDGSRSVADITANFVGRSSLNGTITQEGTTALPSPATFSSLYRSAFDQTLTLADLAGIYEGVITTGLGEESASFAIDASGALAGGSASGCSVNGQATAQPSGNVFNINASFGSEDACGANRAVSVVGILSLEVDTLTALALNDGSTNSFIFTGTRP